MNSSTPNRQQPTLFRSWKNPTWCSCGFESVRSIEDRHEGLVVDFSRCGSDDVCDLGLRWVLAERTEEIAQGLPGNRAGAFLVEERKRFFVFWIEVGESRRFRGT